MSQPTNPGKSNPGKANPGQANPGGARSVTAEHRVRTPFSTTASAAIVNRTHRVIRQRAATIEASKKKFRSLWIPLAVSGGLLVVIICAVWSVLDQYELAPTGLPDANQQMLVLMLWCLPLSVVLLAVVWFRRGGSNSFKADHENNAR